MEWIQKTPARCERPGFLLFLGWLLLILGNDADRNAGRSDGHLSVAERYWVALGSGVLDAGEVIAGRVVG